MTAEQIMLLKNKIADLSQRNITHKTIRGMRYAYRQWTENVKQRSKAVKPEDVESLVDQIRERKNLEQILTDKEINVSEIAHEFVTEENLGLAL